MPVCRAGVPWLCDGVLWPSAVPACRVLSLCAVAMCCALRTVWCGRVVWPRVVVMCCGRALTARAAAPLLIVPQNGGKKKQKKTKTRCQFGSVFRGTYFRGRTSTVSAAFSDQTQIAIKMLNDTDEVAARVGLDDLMTEALVTCQFHHVNVVSVVGVR